MQKWEFGKIFEIPTENFRDGGFSEIPDQEFPVALAANFFRQNVQQNSLRTV